MGSEVTDDQVQRAVAQGATLEVGGTRDGAFYPGTVLTGVTSDMDAYREEFFGPVATVYRVSGEDEAVAIANDTGFGLGSYVFTTDAAQAERIADRIEAVVGEAAGETEDARTRLASATLSDVDAAEQQRALVEPIIQRGLSRDFAVVLAGPAGTSGVAADPGGGGATYTFGLDRTSVPASLVDHFSTIATPSWTYTTIRRLGPDGETPVSEPGIAVGSQVTLPADGRTYTLYLPSVK